MDSFDPIEFTHRLEQVGLDRRQAETLASELRRATQELVTREQLNSELDRLFIRQSGAVAAMLAVAATLSKLFA